MYGEFHITGFLETTKQVHSQTVKAKMECAFNQSVLLAKIESIIMYIHLTTLISVHI